MSWTEQDLVYPVSPLPWVCLRACTKVIWQQRHTTQQKSQTWMFCSDQAHFPSASSLPSNTMMLCYQQLRTKLPFLHQLWVHTSISPVQNQRLTLPPSSHTMMLWQNTKHWLGKEYHVHKESGRSPTLSWKLMFSTSPFPYPSSLPPEGRSLCLSCSLLFFYSTQSKLWQSEFLPRHSNPAKRSHTFQRAYISYFKTWRFLPLSLSQTQWTP